MTSVRRLIAPVGRLVRPRWFVTNVAALPAAGPAPFAPPGLSVRLGSPDDAGALTPLVRGRESLAWRFTRGDVVLIAELASRVVGCTWLTCQPLRPSYFPILVRPKPGEWYNYGLVILPEYRLRGLGRTLSRRAMEEAQRRGGHVIFGHALRLDRAAAASHAAAGFVSAEELLGFSIFDRFAVLLYRRRRANGWR
ncbi:MAG TPA: GNAT family N-acetyltransferase [Candidatus Methylomirabilis sp.]|nr:GNAT family N-acetyltransferase [Candidatus Methylomirabilis sp.]